MIITCEKCDTSFRLDENLLKPEGSKVRCSKCKYVFTAYPPQPTPEPEDAAVVAEDSETGREEGSETGGIDLAELDAIFGGGLPDDGEKETAEDIPAAVADHTPGESETDQMEETDDLDMDLDFDLDIEPESAGSGEDTARLDDLDLDMDFDLEEEELDFDFETDLETHEEQEAEQSPDRSAEPDEVLQDVSLDDLEIKDELEVELEADEAESAEKEDTAEISTEEPELSLAPESGGGIEIETEEQEPETDKEQHLDSDGQFEELDLEMEQDEQEQDAEKQAEAELDFSDLESVLDEDQDDEFHLEIDDRKEEPELELDSDKGEEQPAEDLEDLEFQLDSEFDEKTGEEADEPKEELDLTDIEQMLEEGPTSIEGAGQDGGVEGREDDLIIQDELDLSELEQAIEEADKEVDVDKEEDLELELDLPDEADSGEDSNVAAIDEELELDISEVEQPDDGVISKSASLTMDTGDIDLQFEIEDEEPPGEERPVPQELEKITQTVQVDEKDSGFELEKEEAEEPAPGPPKTPKPARPPKKGVSKTLVFLLIVVVLGGIGYGLYYAVTEMGVQIPYLSDYLKPQPQDPYGTLRLSTFDITSKFMENQNDGRLFVITGKVRNGYDNSRAMIRVRGNLFTTGKKLVKTEYAYCGVILPDSDLVQKPFLEIKKLLNQRPTPSQPGGGLQPGQAARFMVVFANLPENLEEFTIELVGSLPAGR